ncbi:uncharacterized protein B4U80_04734 [Leptotrombidium deliense]|uniref:ZP domain-containing protein n=1 Tax=Leptotrombidium deliense TaxID=299467 RepID=A0A443ST84_9ACAR|nr:uncharacterized protein B4U80_04734 [Leptotrombidium deliense]
MLLFYAFLCFCFQILDVYCFEPIIEAKCERNYLRINVLTSKPFNGIIHTRDSRDKCFQYGNGSTSTLFSIDLLSSSNECGVKVKKISQSIEDKYVLIAIRQQKEIELKDDRFYSVGCSTSTAFLSSRNISSRIVLEFTGADADVEQQQLDFGAKYNLKASMSPFKDDKINFNLYSCLAFWDRNEIALLDEYGCPTESKLMSEFDYSENGEATATIDSMFKFPNSYRFHIQCYFTTCFQCQRFQCGSTKKSQNVITKRRDDYLTTTTVYLNDFQQIKAKLQNSEEECTEWRFPWMITLLICLSILLLFMFCTNLFLCSSLSCQCTKTEISDENSSDINEFDDYDPYKIDYSSPSPSLKR